MGIVGKVLSFVRETVEGVPIAHVKIDPGGGNNLTAEHTQPAGQDSQPLPGDYMIPVRDVRSGELIGVAYFDPNNPGIAAKGEWRAYARNASGGIVAVIYLKNNGDTLLGSDTATDPVSLSSKSDTEINRIWDVLTGFVPNPGDGGAALKTAATTARAGVQSTASSAVKSI